MNPFRSFTQQIDQWWRVQFLSTSQQQANGTLQQTILQVKRYTKTAQLSQPWQQILRLKGLKPKQLMRVLWHQPPRKRPRSKGPQPQIIFLIALIALTSTIGYRFYNEPKLDVGTVAPQTLRAPDSAVVEDEKTTEEKRQATITGAVPVLTIDQTVNQQIYQSLQRIFEEAERLRAQAGPFPFAETSVLSTNTQNYLRQAEEWEWRATITAAEGNGAAWNNRPSIQNSNGMPSSSDHSTDATRSSQQLAIIELQSYRRTASVDDFSALKQAIIRARQRYTATMASLTASVLSKPNELYDEALLNLTDEQWEETKVGIRRSLERILTQGIPAGLPPNLLAEAIRVQTESDVPQAVRDLAVDTLTWVIKPNLREDQEQTRQRAEQAAEAIEPEVVEVRRGETIVQAGEAITQQQFVLLDYFGMSRRGINWLGLSGFGALVAGAMGVYLLVEHRLHPGLRRRDHILILLLCLTTPLVLALRLPSINLPLVGLLVGSFYGSGLGVTVVSLLSLVLPVGITISWSHLTASAAGSLLGTIIAGRLRSREELAMLGGAVGLTTGLVYLLMSLIVSSAASSVWYSVFTTAAVQGMMGVVWSIVALGLSPYLEHLFDVVTPIRLVELSNPNRPLLKRVASQAPGTFQHTLFVASLAEAAARELGCNVELVRAGTLYHDIGKMHDPLGFIENQMGGPNKHDLIADPWRSADIIKKHVTEGLVMARKCRLPTAIQAFIPEHQGTMLINYFYYQAQQQAKADPTIFVKEDDFRYEGPIPQSKETGIVMLADSCEAALRSLKDATSEEALAMVNRILKARWQDNQLVDSGLTRQEMSHIANIFVQVWQQFNHKRIPYPKGAMSPKPSPVSL